MKAQKIKREDQKVHGSLRSSKPLTGFIWAINGSTKDSYQAVNLLFEALESK
jgi:hypothetical protein